MATIARLVPSSYTLSSTRLSIADASNMYTNTDSTTYATITNTYSSTSSYYAYITGFNFSSVPDNAVVSSIEIKLKASHSGGNTSTIYGYTYNNGTATQISAAGSTTALETSATVKTFSNTTIAWDTLKGYGSTFGIRINCRRSNRNTQATFQIYGAEIAVTYTVPVYHDVSVSGDGTLDPTGTTSVLEGDPFVLHISGITPTVTDNNVDVTSQLVQTTEVTETSIPNGNTNSGFTLSNISNAYHDATNTTYAQLQLAGSNTGTIYFDMSDISIPSGASITGVTASATLQYNRNNSTSGFTASCQMYAGSSAKGSSTSVVSSGSSDVARTTFTLSPGSSWTATEINSARFYITATNSARSTVRYLYVYGVSFNITYESSGVTYIYTISSVTADHTIVVSAGSASDKIYFKTDGSESLVNSVFCADVSTNTTFQVDLTGFSVGDICKVTNELYVVNSGRTEHIESIVHSFTWTGQSYTYDTKNGGQDGYTLTITPTTLKLQTTYGWGIYARGDQNYDNYIRFYKVTGGWVPSTKVYKKVNGSWVEQSDLTTVFDTNTNYVKGN